MANQNVGCDCYDFCVDLMQIAKQILVEEDDGLHWEMFEQFLKKHIVLMSSILRHLPRTFLFCPLRTCSLIAGRLEKYRRCYGELSTFLVDLITCLHFKPCSPTQLRKIAYIAKELQTLRGLSALKGMDSEYMKLMVNRGLVSSLPADTPYLLDELEEKLYSFFKREGFDADDDALNEVIEEAIHLLQGSFFRDGNQKNLKRIFLTITALNAIQLNVRNYSNAEEAISCLRMYFDASPDPLLSVFEARRVFYVCFALLNKLQLLYMYYERFQYLLPECPDKREPRTLTHLACCQIRENLSASRLPLPSAVEKLFVPKTLKRYILGDVDDISRKRRQKSLTISDLMSSLREQRSGWDTYFVRLYLKCWPRLMIIFRLCSLFSFSFLVSFYLLSH